MRVLVGFLATALATPAWADAGDRWDGVMIAEQTGGGILGGAVLGLGGAFAGAGIASWGSSGRGSWGAALGGGLIGGGLGSVTGVVLGVKFTGDHRGGNGSWGATITGGIAGGLLTIVTLPQYADKLPTWASVSLATVTMVAPTIVAYQFSTDENATTEKRVVIPLVTMRR